FARGLELAEESLAVAERAGLKLTALRLSRGICIQYAFDGRFELARRAADWVVDELESSGDRERLADLYVSARSVREGVLALADDLDAAERSAVETYELAGRIPNRTVRSMTASALAQIHLMRGEYAEAKRWAEESLEIAEAIANLGALPAAAAVAIRARSVLAIATLGTAELAAAAGTHPPGARQLEQALAVVRALRLERYRPRLERVIAGAGAAVVVS